LEKNKQNKQSDRFNCSASSHWPLAHTSPPLPGKMHPDSKGGQIWSLQKDHLLCGTGGLPPKSIRLEMWRFSWFTASSWQL